MKNLSDSQKLNPTIPRKYDDQSKKILSSFNDWSEQVQTEFFNNALSCLSHAQLKIFEQIISPLLQKDIIGCLEDESLGHLSARILSYLDPLSLSSASKVSKKWENLINQNCIWKSMIEERVEKDPICRKLLTTSSYENLFFSSEKPPQTDIYEKIFYKLDSLETILKKNWNEGNYKLERICCGNDINRGVYCIQYDDDKIICGLRDNTIKVWNLKNQELLRVLRGHEGSVLCLQYRGDILISGSSDSTIRIWNHVNMLELDKIEMHSEPVLHLKFTNEYLITCSKDYTISIFEIKCLEPMKVKMKQLTLLREHKAAVNVIDFDHRYLISASGDRTIKVWQMDTFKCLQTLTGHRRGIACLQFHEDLIISGSSDHTIRVWDISIGSCVRVLFGHEELVRCIRFDSEFIISGAYDGKIKVWNLSDVINKNTPHASLKATTLCEHTSRVFKLQFDSFKIVSSSQDDTILIWDFLGLSPNELDDFWNLSCESKISTSSYSNKPHSALFHKSLPSSKPMNFPKSKFLQSTNCDINKTNSQEHNSTNSNFKFSSPNLNQKTTDDNSLNQLIESHRENHTFTRMLRKCLSLKKIKKDNPSFFGGANLFTSSSGITTPSSQNFIRLSTEVLNQTEKERELESEIFATSLSSALINTQFSSTNSNDRQRPSSLIHPPNPTSIKLSRTNDSILMETDSPVKEDFSDSRQPSRTASKHKSFSGNEFDDL